MHNHNHPTLPSYGSLPRVKVTDEKQAFLNWQIEMARITRRHEQNKRRIQYTYWGMVGLIILLGVTTVVGPELVFLFR
jgi:hypothetical protein